MSNITPWQERMPKGTGYASYPAYLAEEITELRTALAKAEQERDAALAELAAIRAQEPVGWYSRQYGFVYMSRQPHQFEIGSILYLKDGTPAWKIMSTCSKLALISMANIPHGTVFYAAAGAAPEKGEIVITKTQDGQIVAVTRQDEEGQILKVIATAGLPEFDDVLADDLEPVAAAPKAPC